MPAQYGTCPRCRGFRDIHILTIPDYAVTTLGVPLTFPSACMHCGECGEDWYTGKQSQAHQAAHEAACLAAGVRRPHHYRTGWNR